MKKFAEIVFSFLLLMSAAVPAQGKDVLILDENDVNGAVRREFADQGVDDEIELEFFGGKTTFALQNAGLARIMISNLRIDEGQNTFSADAEIFADGEPVEKTRLSGKYYVRVSAYVPNRTIEKGTVIAEDMLKEISLRANRVKDNNIVDKDRLIGLQAKKSLKEGRLIAEREVGQKVLIRKGDVVTAIYKSRGLQITSKAEAGEDGAEKQRIELENVKSGKKFRARVIDAATVEIDNE